MDADLVNLIDSVLDRGGVWAITRGAMERPLEIVISIPTKTELWSRNSIRPVVASQYARMIELAMRRGNLEHAQNLILLAAQQENELRNETIGPDSPIGDLFPTAIVNALESIGVEVLADLSEKTRDDLIEIPQFSITRLETVEAVLTKYGMALKN